MIRYQKEAGGLLKSIRAERKLTVEDVSFGANISPEVLSDIESGNSRPSLDTLDKILKALGKIESIDKGKRQELLALYSRTGSEKLRELRDSRELSQEGLALGAGVSTRTVSAIERGENYQPSKDVLQYLLAALDSKEHVTLQDRQAIFTAYGYRKPFPLPSPHEIEMARQQWRDNFSTVPFPAYLLTCDQKLLAWNRYAPKLLGLSIDDPETMVFDGVSIFDVTFTLSGGYVEIANRDKYLPDLIRSSRAQDLKFSHEDWYENYVQEERQKHPEFARLYDEVEEDQLDPTTLGNAVPIELKVSGLGLLTFRLMRVEFNNDPRFFVTQWIPVDLKTMLQCVIWINEEEAKSSNVSST